MNYTVTFLGPQKGKIKVGVRDVSCASEAESIARKEHPDKPLYDICRYGHGSGDGTKPSSTRKKLEE